MTTRSISLGKIDIFLAQPVDDFSAGSNTGLRIAMRQYSHVTFVGVWDKGSSTDDLQLDLREHTASSGGTSQDLDIITEYFTRGEDALDGDEAWALTTQTAASEISAIAGSAELENLLVFEVHQDQLSDGYTHLSINTPDFAGGGTKWGAILTIGWLLAAREPTLLPYALTGNYP